MLRRFVSVAVLAVSATAAAQPDGAPAPAEPSAPAPSARTSAAWLSVGAGIALVTIGAVFALSVEATEDDLADLYLTGAGEQPRAFDATTAARYQDLVDRGERYQTLSWVSFGLGAAAAAAATYWFVTAERAAPASARARLTPVLAPGAAGVGARWGF
jgi:hypothetical protein